MAAVRRIHPELPLFVVPAGQRTAIYTPGHLAVVSPAQAQALERRWRAHEDPPAPGNRIGQVAATLETHARLAVNAWQALRNAPFAPEVLTVYLSTACNLACTYCFSRHRRTGAGTLDENAVAAAAALVAGNCAARQKPFTLVVHGGGEPTVHWDLMGRVVDATRRIAAQAGVDWQGHVATNGVLSAARVRWLARHFTSIGVSCDGPPGIQDSQRPFGNGKGSAAVVARTIRRLADQGADVAVRATITPQTMARQEHIVDYLGARLGAKRMRFEPVYRMAGRAGFAPDQAEAFAETFVKAQARARALGAELTLSGVRLDEIHGPYCNLLRNVLHLVPGPMATACFFCTDAGQAQTARSAIATFDPTDRRLIFDPARIAVLRQKACRLPAPCQACINIFHCARQCPDQCHCHRQTNPGDRRWVTGFRCRLARRLATAWINDLALGETAAIQGPQAAITDRLAPTRRRLPAPVWAKRPYDHDGAQAWQVLSQRPATAPGPMSIYVHVPFCDRRCRFCDCQAMVLGHGNRHLAEAFGAVLADEIQAWSQIPAMAQRPVTTVHFGGGTPGHLGPKALAAIVTRIKRRFGVGPATEWAMETTTSLVTEAFLEQLRRWGFGRLHIGVQSLQDPVRRSIGRHESAQAVLGKINLALARGFVVSVDLICGLPGQTMEGLLAGLEALVTAGVHGASLYGLQVSGRNYRALARLEATGRDLFSDHALFQAAHHYLIRRGYAQNHFTHYALPADQNLYYTYPLRGEDLLGLGPTANGQFGAYHYRHPGLRDYVRPTGTGFPVLDGGLWESAPEKREGPFAKALMGGRLPGHLAKAPELGPLGALWRQQGLVAPDGAGNDLVLTADGAWFIDTMLGQVEDVFSDP